MAHRQVGPHQPPQVTGKVLTGPVWVVFYWLCEHFAAAVEPIKKGWSWGWSYRKIAGSAKWSNHASGTAVDLNAPRHPAGKRGTFTKAQQEQIRLILAASHGVLRWGQLFKDEMHFEIAPGVSAAKVRTLAVMILQEALSSLGYDIGRAGVDGIYGPCTSTAYVAFRAAAGLPPATLWTDPATWAAITLARNTAKENTPA